MSLESRLRRLEGARSAAATEPPRVTVPNVIEFATGPQYLAQRIFPRQATLLKLLFLAPELLIDYDRTVMAEWTAGFTLADRDDGTTGYRGRYGMAPDILDRIGYCRALGRRYFREVVLVAGRRGSKGWLGAVATAYVLWHLLAIEDPQAHFGIPSGKQLHVLVFAGQLDQALTNQWRDVVELIRSAACFAPFVAEVSRDRLWLHSAAQVAAGNVAPRDAAFVISARQATPLAGRGQAAVVEIFDELAHVVAGGANRSAEEIFSAAVPALAQFGRDSFLFEASSPWQQQGQFYLNYLRGLAVDPLTRRALDPDMLVLQLPSHELYQDWELTQTGQLSGWPGGPPLQPLDGPIFDLTDADRLRRGDPANFDVEYDAQWATSMAAYLQPADVDGVFARWHDAPLSMQASGHLATRYIAHADPSVSGANFAVMVAHREVDTEDRGHVIVDHIQVWQPSSFPDGRIDYELVTAELRRLIDRFRIQAFSFDQFNSAGLMDHLRAHTRDNQLPTMITERTATSASNQRMYENLKTALTRRVVHAPHHPLLEAELRHLETRNGRVNHPTRGPVQTCDVADCLMNVVDALISDNNDYQLLDDLGRTPVRASRQAHPLAAKFDAVHKHGSLGSQGGTPRGWDPGRGNGGRPRRGAP